MVSLLIFFAPECSLSTLILLITVLLVHENCFLAIQHLPLIAIIVTVCSIISILTLYMWIEVGNANANFLFFEGLVLWVILAVGIVEFLSVMIKNYSK